MPSDYKQIVTTAALPRCTAVATMPDRLRGVGKPHHMRKVTLFRESYFISGKLVFQITSEFVSVRRQINLEIGIRTSELLKAVPPKIPAFQSYV